MGPKFIILSQTFYLKDTDPKVFLQNIIMEHGLWAKVIYWVSAIIEATEAELANDTYSDGKQTKGVALV